MTDIFYKGTRLRPLGNGSMQVLTENGLTTLGWYSVSSDFADKGVQDALTYIRERRNLDNFIENILKERASGNTAPKMPTSVSTPANSPRNPNTRGLTYIDSVRNVQYYTDEQGKIYRSEFVSGKEVYTPISREQVPLIIFSNLRR